MEDERMYRTSSMRFLPAMIGPLLAAVVAAHATGAQAQTTPPDAASPDGDTALPSTDTTEAAPEEDTSAEPPLVEPEVPAADEVAFEDPEPSSVGAFLANSVAIHGFGFWAAGVTSANHYVYGSDDVDLSHVVFA